MRTDSRPDWSRGVVLARRIVPCGVLPLTVATLLLAPAAPAQIPGLEWSEPEIVELNVTDVSSPSGASAAHAPGWLHWGQGEWHIVYAKDSHIYRRVRTATGWLAAERLTSDGAIARDPHLAFGGGYLHVVWEDSRTGHAEVYVRRWNGSVWSAEVCLTCDATASARPVVAGGPTDVLVVWQESTVSGGAIYGREGDGTSWGTPRSISQSPAVAAWPTVAAETLLMNTFRVAWSDTRHGAPEIYLRLGCADDGWLPEVRLTDLPGGCRRPSVASEVCCGDWINPQALVLFEYDDSGTVETYEACYDEAMGNHVQQLSPGDGVASLAPSACGFTLEAVSCALLGGGAMSHYFGCWTDSLEPHAGSHLVRAFEMCYPKPESDRLPATGYARATLASIEGDPLAGLMALWVEDRAGVPTLMAQRGRTAGCYREEFEPPRVIWLAPEGTPASVVRLVDTCTGNPASHQLVGLTFSAELDAALTWDPVQPHPELPYVETDHEGNAYFAIRGGGCSASGSVYGWCAQPYEHVFLTYGAKSPDVDGDCRVGGDDFEYVESMLGTTDFCADLDGSGTVDASDLVLVRSTLGDHCSDLPSSAGEPHAAGDERTPPVVTLLSNPCHDAAAIRCVLSAPARVATRVLDPAGGLVRDLGERDLPAGPAAVVWDTRDAGGRRVASGVYFLALRGPRWEVRRGVLVLR